MSDEKSPFQIRDFRIATRELAKACANRAGLTMAEWMDRAVHSQERVDRQESIFPPPGVRPVADDTEIIRLIDAAAGLAAQEARGLRSVPGLVALLADRVRDARGLPARQPRVKPTRQYRKTRPARPDWSPEKGIVTARFADVDSPYPHFAESEPYEWPRNAETARVSPSGDDNPNDVDLNATLTSAFNQLAAPKSTPEIGEGELRDLGGEITPCHPLLLPGLPPTPAEC